MGQKRSLSGDKSIQLWSLLTLTRQDSGNPLISARMEGLIFNYPNPSLSKTILLKTPFLYSAFRHHQITPCGSFCSRSLSFSVTCSKVKPSQDKKQKNVSNKIVLSEAAPPLAEQSDNSGNNTEPEVNNGNGSGLMKLVKRLPKRVLGVLSNLPLAIGEMFTIAALMALGIIHHFLWFCFKCFRIR